MGCSILPGSRKWNRLYGQTRGRAGLELGEEGIEKEVLGRRARIGVTLGAGRET